MKSGVDRRVPSSTASGRWLILGAWSRSVPARDKSARTLARVGREARTGRAREPWATETAAVVNGKWAPEACNKNEPAFAPARIWQITDQEYVNVVRDVLGITLTGADAEISSAANSTGAFTNLSEGGSLFNDMIAQNYQSAAQRVATQAATKMPTLLGSATPTNAQVQTFITSKVARLWRRPPSSAEVTALTNVYQNGVAAADGGPANALGLLLQAVLQAPSFLFRTELGANPTPAGRAFPSGSFRGGDGGQLSSDRRGAGRRALGRQRRTDRFSPTTCSPLRSIV